MLERFQVWTGPILGAQAHAVAVAMSADLTFDDRLRDLDAAFGGVIQDGVASGEFRGQIHEVLTMRSSERTGAHRVILYGLGPRQLLSRSQLVWIHHSLAVTAGRLGYERLAVASTTVLLEYGPVPIISGVVLGTWQPEHRNHAESPGTVRDLVLAGFACDGEQLSREVVIADAANRTRSWQQTPPNLMRPRDLVEAATSIGSSHRLHVEVLGSDELRDAGYNLVAGVGQGSTESSYLVGLTYRGRGSGPLLGMVGKGITFDSGGISLKAPRDMLTMKGDMAGAAAVLAAIEAICSLEMSLDVLAVLAIAENMPGSTALRPGDVLESACGKTVEVVNTDCEGRLVLADALTYARRQGATILVDVATLTIPDPLGHMIIAATSNDDALWTLVNRAADISGEHLHRFPMIPEWQDVIRSDAADLSNGFYTEARTSTAGMFLAEFVDRTPWVHLDIAGPAWNDNRELLALPRGPLGAGARTLVRLAELLCIADEPESYGTWAVRGVGEAHAQRSGPRSAAARDFGR